VDPTASTTIYGNSTVVTDFVTVKILGKNLLSLCFDGNNSFANIKSPYDGVLSKRFLTSNKPTGNTH
jgi:hypothetical protein